MAFNIDNFRAHIDSKNEIAKVSHFEVNIQPPSAEDMDKEYQQKLKEKEKDKTKLQHGSQNGPQPGMTGPSITYINEGQSHNVLRDEFNKYSLEETDKMIEQKQRYNNILKSLSEII